METLIATTEAAAAAAAEINRHESIPSKVTTTGGDSGAFISSLSIDILQPPLSERRRSNFSSRASTVSECESLKLEETIERLEEVVEKLTARETASSIELDKSNPFDEPLSDAEECCTNDYGGGGNCEEDGEEEEEEEIDQFPDIIFLPSLPNSNTSTVRVTDRSAASTVSSGMASEEDFDYDQTKNPFSPYFRPSAKKASQPNPFECSSFVTDAFTTPPIIPKLDLQEHFSTAARPSEALNILSKTNNNNNPNPFRVEAWGPDSRDVQTARVDAWHQTSIDSDDEDAVAAAAAAEDDIYEVEIKEGSHSAPNTQRKLAPCAVTYPQTEAFINLVMGDIHGFMEIESTAKFYPDGCFTVSSPFLISDFGNPNKKYILICHF
uniref:Uncharacterized protein n=1 Tax=Panagrolaimus superbus TaxID=310955 RepID=A0A914Z351_9BILA